MSTQSCSPSSSETETGGHSKTEALLSTQGVAGLHSKLSFLKGTRNENGWCGYWRIDSRD